MTWLKDIGNIFKGGVQFLLHGDKQGHGIRDVARFEAKGVSDAFSKGLKPELEQKNLHNQNISKIVKDGETVMKASLSPLSTGELQKTIEWEKKTYKTGVKPIDKIVGAGLDVEKSIGKGMYTISTASINTFGAVAKPVSEIAKADVMVAKTGLDVGEKIVSNLGNIENIIYDVSNFIGNHPYLILGIGGYILLKNA